MVDHVIVITNDIVALDDDSSYQTTWNAVLSHLNLHFPGVKRLDGIILGPGPGNPSVMHDVGICAAAIHANPMIPILGVCLGHQLLAHMSNVTVSYASQPMHGRISAVRVVGDNSSAHHPAAKMLFHSIGTAGKSSKEFDVTRYHSLSVQKIDEKSPIIPLAYSIPANAEEKEELMALAVLDKPWIGVQFHPESIGTISGKTMLQNWCQFVSWFATASPSWQESNFFQWDQVPDALFMDWNKNVSSSSTTDIIIPETRHQRNQALGQQLPMFRNSNTDVFLSRNNTSGNTCTKPSSLTKSLTNNNNCSRLEYIQETQNFKYQILIHKLPGVLEATHQQQSIHKKVVKSKDIFDALYSDMTCAFWLDSSNSDCSASQSSSSLSIMGSMGGPYAHLVEYIGAASGSAEEDKNNTFRSVDSSKKEVRVHFCHNGSPSAETTSYVYETDVLSYLREKLFPCDGSGPLVAEEEIYVVNSICLNDTIINSKCSKSNIIAYDSTYTIPFDYRGGYVGFLGYEVRHDTLRLLNNITSHASIVGRRVGSVDESLLKHSSALIPDAAFIFTDQSIVCDHCSGDVYLLGYALSSRSVIVSTTASSSAASPNDLAVSDSVSSVISWMRTVAETIQNLQQSVSFSNATTAIPLQQTSDNNGNCTSSRTDDLARPRNISYQRYDQEVISTDVFAPLCAKTVYTDNISRCHEYIRLGESYELCLTTQLVLDTATISTINFTPQMNLTCAINGETSSLSKHTQTQVTEKITSLQEYLNIDPYSIYEELRNSNPAPFASFLRLDPAWQMPVDRKAIRTSQNSVFNKLPTSMSLAVCSSSPERFLSLSSKGILESKPIKGTCPRGVGSKHDKELATALQRSEKNAAENLMIVDLIRNDFGRICKVGSISVPSFCELESFSSVHQLVSTILGELKDGYSAIDALVAAFPGGSMTGAPKKRTMELLHDLEEKKPRGPYSGCMGYISPNNAMDMNIVIRTAVISPSSCVSGSRTNGLKIHVGAGGAITALSDKDDEYEEMILKTRAVVSAITRVLNRVLKEKYISPSGHLLDPSDDIAIALSCSSRN